MTPIKKKPSFSLLPMTLVVAIVTAGLHLVNVMQGLVEGRYNPEFQEAYQSGAPEVGQAIAADDKKEDKKKDDKKDDKSKDKDKKDKKDYKKDSKDKSKADDKEGEGVEESAKDGEGDGAEGDTEKKPASLDKLPKPKDFRSNELPFSKSELEVLQNLAKRRDQLAADEKALLAREALIKAAETRMDEKIAQMTTMRTEIQGLLKQYDEKQEQQVMALVDVYSKMKPKDAARIFDSLELKVLLDVLARMQSRLTAPILAEMNPERAQEVTIHLVERGSLPKGAGEL